LLRGRRRGSARLRLRPRGCHQDRGRRRRRERDRHHRGPHGRPARRKGPRLRRSVPLQPRPAAGDAGAGQRPGGGAGQRRGAVRGPGHAVRLLRRGAGDAGRRRLGRPQQADQLPLGRRARSRLPHRKPLGERPRGARRGSRDRARRRGIALPPLPQADRPPARPGAPGEGDGEPPHAVRGSGLGHGAGARGPGEPGPLRRQRGDRGLRPVRRAGVGNALGPAPGRARRRPHRGLGRPQLHGARRAGLRLSLTLTLQEDRMNAVRFRRLLAAVPLLVLAFALPAAADNEKGFKLSDPTGDDKGPGTYTYPTAAVYKPGSFDITEFEVVPGANQTEFRISVRTRIEDPWDSPAWGGNGFSVQMAFIHIDTDHKKGSGVQDGLPGTNVRFSEDEAWDRVIIVSPQGATRVSSEVGLKASQWKDKIIVPKVTRAQGKTLIAVVDNAQLGGPPQTTWGYQVLMQSNEGFPDKKDLLTRKVNEFEGQHRFGGGSDYDNDPHVMD